MTDTSSVLVRDHLIVALDLPTADEAVDLVEALEGRVSKFKLGSRLFTRYGPSLVERVAELGAEVFLDLKFHDIPSVVEEAVIAAAEHDGVFMLTVHASGGQRMVRRAVAAARASDGPGPLVVAVTALTSLDDDEIEALTGGLGARAWVDRLGGLALDEGADGLVCSAREITSFRDRFGDEPVLVTPGIRPAGQQGGDDQRRVVTPARALSDGSDFLVIGRPVYTAPDPVAAVKQIGETLTRD